MLVCCSYETDKGPLRDLCEETVDPRIVLSALPRSSLGQASALLGLLAVFGPYRGTLPYYPHTRKLHAKEREANYGNEREKYFEEMKEVLHVESIAKAPGRTLGLLRIAS